MHCLARCAYCKQWYPNRVQIKISMLLGAFRSWCYCCFLYSGSANFWQFAGDLFEQRRNVTHRGVLKDWNELQTSLNFRCWMTLDVCPSSHQIASPPMVCMSNWISHNTKLTFGRGSRCCRNWKDKESIMYIIHLSKENHFLHCLSTVIDDETLTQRGLHLEERI